MSIQSFRCPKCGYFGPFSYPKVHHENEHSRGWRMMVQCPGCSDTRAIHGPHFSAMRATVMAAKAVTQ